MERSAWMDPTVLSDLIGLIYETATDDSAWPLLLDQLGRLLMSQQTHSEPQGPDPSRSAVEGAQMLARCLSPHFERAQGIHLELSSLTTQRDGLEAALSRVPLGMAVVQADGTVVSMNRAMAAMANGSQVLQVEGGRLRTPPEQGLLAQVGQVCAGQLHDVVCQLKVPNGTGRLSVWLSPLLRGHGEHLALLLVASGQSMALSADALVTMYGLTPAESRLAQRLVLGADLEEACQTLAISVNTAKTHLKRVYAKVGVRRQSELVQAVYASPLWLLSDSECLPQRDALGLGKLLSRRRQAVQEEGVVPLKDGRRLSYSDQGDPQGMPVVFMHGMAGSRYLRHPDDSLLLQHGVRLIIPERPGSGDSDPLAGREITDWPKDLAQLLQHLRLARFAVMGYSAGTPYALATALAMPDRVSALHLVAPISPVERMSDLRAYPTASRINILMARHAPALLVPLLGAAVKDMRRNIFRYVENTMSQSTASDRQVYESPQLRTAHAVGVLAGIQRGGNELAQEVLLSCGDWGLDFSRVSPPAHIWHGEADPLVALAGTRHLCARLPGARLTVIPGGGHFIIYSHWREILAGLSQDFARPRGLQVNA